jgi:hypothetical protein
MALKKSVENDMGSTVEYWRVMPQITVDFSSGTAVAQLAVWVTEAARRADKRCGNLHECLQAGSDDSVRAALTLSGQDFTSALMTGDLRAAFYAQLKALPLLSDAVDV